MKNILLLNAVFLSFGCSHQVNSHADSTFSNVTVENQGQSLDDDQVIVNACKDFSISKDSVHKFFNQAKTISELTLHNQHDILPCYSTGSLSFNNQEYIWRIRAGGTGELSTEKETINKVCSKEDCSNIPNLH